MNKSQLQAHERILNGDDTPNRRWLKEHLSGKLCPETGNKQLSKAPEAWTDIVEDDSQGEIE